METKESFMMPYHHVDAQIRAERERQDAKFGQQEHGPFTWLAILGEEVGEANKAAIDAFCFRSEKFDAAKLAHYREELIQVAAVARSMVECLDRGEWRVIKRDLKQVR